MADDIKVEIKTNVKKEKPKKQKPIQVDKPVRSKGFCHVWAAVVTLIITAVYFYFALPPINIHSVHFWGWLLGIIAIYMSAFMLFKALFINARRGVAVTEQDELLVGSMFIGIVTVIIIMIIGGIAGSPLFRAKKYANLITVEEADFQTDMPETTEITNIALMDTASAKVLGNRKLGSLSDVVSQFEISDQYTQINYKGSPQKVANLEYNNFFKWANNNENGVPGYVRVDPLTSQAYYVKLNSGMKYVDSAFFGEDLMRKLRFSYPTKIFGDTYFEVDDEDNPRYIISCMKPNAGLFGAKDVSEVIIFNPCDGSSEIYDVKNVPQWVDVVYTGDLATKKYNWYGELGGGFFNSIFSQKGCRMTTDDYGYLAMDDDIWYYTGVTSVTGDESNIGFILSNARTGEYKFYPIVGAEEYSAMSAAEGEVQEKGYEASFPSLINVADQASYIMVLKDNNKLVKLYALVNVENYSYVATGESQAKAIANYKRLLIEKGVISEKTEIIDEEEPETINLSVYVSEVRFADIDGNTYIYILDDKGQLYKSAVYADESVMSIREGSTVVLSLKKEDGIATFDSWSLLEAPAEQSMPDVSGEEGAETGENGESGENGENGEGEDAG